MHKATASGSAFAANHAWATSEKSAARPGRIETNTKSMKLSGTNQRLRMMVTGRSPSA
jgi:hypothetical protein